MTHTDTCVRDKYVKFITPHPGEMRYCRTLLIDYYLIHTYLHFFIYFVKNTILTFQKERDVNLIGR